MATEMKRVDWETVNHPLWVLNLYGVLVAVGVVNPYTTARCIAYAFIPVHERHSRPKGRTVP